MSNASEVMKTIKDNDVKYVDLRFTDPRGKMQHVTMDVSQIDEDAFADGIMFDGSSIAGWKAINESDMTLMTDPESAAIDPFFAQTTLAIFCDILDPGTGEPYNRDPRTTAKKAHRLPAVARHRRHRLFRSGSRVLHLRRRALLRRRPTTPASRSIHPSSRPTATTEYEGGNLGHRVRTKGGYFPVPPIELRAGHPLRHADVHGADGRAGGEASPRGRLRPARARHQVPDADQGRRQPAALQVLHPSDRAGLRQDRHLHAEAGSSATTARACTSTSRSGRTASRSSPATNTPTFPTSACSTSAAS